MVNPAHLKTLVDQHATGPSPADLGVPVAEPPPDDGGDMDDGGDEGAAPADPAARGEELLTSWGEFGDTLKSEAKELHDQSHDVGADLLLKDVPDDAIKAVGKAVDRMPDEISMGLAKYVSKLSPADCDALALALCKEIGEDEADEKLLSAFLQQAGKYAGDEVDVDDDFNEPDEDEDEDGGDDDGDEGGAPSGEGVDMDAPE